MDKIKFVEELKEFAEGIGAVAKVNLVNPNGSHLDGVKLETLNENLLKTCQVTSAIIIPKLTGVVESEQTWVSPAPSESYEEEEK